MGGSTFLTLGDVERAIAVGDPQLGELLVRYLEQADPEPGRNELEPTDDGDDEDDEDGAKPEIDVPAGAYTFERLKQSMDGLSGKNPTERKLARREAFAAAEDSPFAPPRLRLGKILIALYERNDDAGRAALLHVFVHGKLKWGVWQAAKAIYKLAEARHDAALFGVLGYRFDVLGATPHEEIGTPTKVYLRRRVWRYLRQLGAAVPDAYATFAVELLRHYPSSVGEYATCWAAAHIFRHGSLSYARDSASFKPPTTADELAKRAYPGAWKLSPAPLLRLLETAQNDLVCNFAILSLRTDHPLALRAVDPAWLARLGRRPLASIHGFVVQLLKDSPEFHQSKLRALGLHDMVIAFLRSPNADARAYALEYAAAHAPDLAVGELVELVETGADPVKKFASARLETMTPQQLGVAVLCRLLDLAVTPWAEAKLAQGFGGRDITAEIFVDTAARGANAYNAIIKFFNAKNATIPATYYTALLDDPRFDGRNYQLRGITTTALTELGKRTAREIGVPWIQRSLEDKNRSAIGRAVARGRACSRAATSTSTGSRDSSRSRGCARSRSTCSRIGGSSSRRASGSHGCSSSRARRNRISRASRSGCCSRASNRAISAASTSCGTSRPARSSPRSCVRSPRRT